MSNSRRRRSDPCEQKEGLDGFFRLDTIFEYMTSDEEFVIIMSLSKEEGVLSPIMDEVTKKVLEIEEELQLKKKTMKYNKLDAGSLSDLGREGDAKKPY